MDVWVDMSHTNGQSNFQFSNALCLCTGGQLQQADRQQWLFTRIENLKTSCSDMQKGDGLQWIFQKIFFSKYSFFCNSIFSIIQNNLLNIQKKKKAASEFEVYEKYFKTFPNGTECNQELNISTATSGTMNNLIT